MRVHNPSIETIKKMLDRVHKMFDKHYALIWSYMRASNDLTNTFTPERAHKLIDELLGNYGIESTRFKYRGQIRTLYYSNTGHSYVPTVLRWDYTYNGVRHVTWFVGCWGDIAENQNYRSID